MTRGVRIGVQAMMLKDAVEELGAFETFRHTAEIGYRVAELSQIRMTAETVAELQRARGELGMEYCALSAGLGPGANDSLEDDFDKIVADARTLDAGLVRIGMLPMPALRSHDAILDFCRRADVAAVRLADEGIALYYHNHHIEFAKIDGRYLLDIIADASPHVGLELDAHWVARGGMDPARVIAQYAGRVRMVHLKDYRVVLPDDDALDARERGDGETWARAWTDVVQFAEVGEGNLDWPGIIAQSVESGADYLLVEQDDLYGRSVWEALETSHRNLVAMGYEELF